MNLKPSTAIIKFMLVTVMVVLVLARCNYEHPLAVNINYEPLCGPCHGLDLKGLTLGSSLLEEQLIYGNSVDSIIQAITKGFPDKGMPAFESTLSEEEIKVLAIWIGEQRANTSYDDFRIKTPLRIPEQSIQSELYEFDIEVIATGINRWPYSIEPLPDGRFLVTEKTKGLRIISVDGQISPLIKGLPKVYDDSGFEPSGLMHGTGWMLDVVAHPDYTENGWIYISHGDRCEDCNQESRRVRNPVSMCRIIRGKIQDGQWVDQEIIWNADIETYSDSPETSTGGRMTFDDDGHLYFSVGAKKFSTYPPGNFESYIGIQDLTLPYGKIYRVNDDGSIPDDNPFHNDPTAIKSIWTYGHRSPQGLEYNL
ncbi:MAG: PQQ-dependent sugar dehydrogenase, partial [Bacteroidia bacterium]|nr:PQQ-dependent sugar dehydrogenase [Bacteroidia bacterium]